MTTARITIGDHTISARVGEAEVTVPIGVSTLAATFATDPPQPEDLTNAIGIVADHLDDVARELPAVLLADTIELAGELVETVAALEVGGTPTWPFDLTRAAAEDVFRTVATEDRTDRGHNPGLPSHHLDSVVAAGCAIVAVMRTLHIERAVVPAPTAGE